MRKFMMLVFAGIAQFVVYLYSHPVRASSASVYALIDELEASQFSKTEKRSTGETDFPAANVSATDVAGADVSDISPSMLSPVDIHSDVGHVDEAVHGRSVKETTVKSEWRLPAPDIGLLNVLVSRSSSPESRVGQPAQTSGVLIPGTTQPTTEKEQQLISADFSGQTFCQVSHQQPITHFSQALLRAVCHEPEIRQMYYGLERARISYQNSYAGYFPQISASVSWGKDESRIHFNQARYKTTDNTETQRLDLEWLLFDFGKREAKVAQQKHLLARETFMQMNELQNFILTFAEKYYNLIAADAYVIAAKNNEAIAHKTWNETRNKHLSGIGVLADELQAKSAWLSAQQYRIQKESEKRAIQGRLTSALGMAFSSPLAPEDKLTVPDRMTMEHIDHLIRMAQKEHPQLVAARKQLESDGAAINAAVRDYFPSVALNSYWQRGVDDLSGFDKTDEFYVGVRVSVPVFSGFQHYNALRAAKTQQRSDTAYLKQLEEAVSLNIWEIWQSMERAGNNFPIIMDRVETTRRAYQVAQGRYRSGVGSIIELLNTQSDLSQAEIDEVNARVEWYLLRLNLLAGLGRLNMANL